MCSIEGWSKVIEGWVVELRLTWLISYSVLIDLVVSGGCSMGVFNVDMNLNLLEYSL